MITKHVIRYFIVYFQSLNLAGLLNCTENIIKLQYVCQFNDYNFRYFFYSIQGCAEYQMILIINSVSRPFDFKSDRYTLIRSTCTRMLRQFFLGLIPFKSTPKLIVLLFIYFISKFFGLFQFNQTPWIIIITHILS